MNIAIILERIIADPKKTLKHLSTEDIADVLERANYAYYVEGDPLFSDTVADMVKTELERRDPKHPILAAVGAPIRADDDRKTKLPYWMGSLDKIKADEKVLSRWKTKFAATDDVQVVVSDKLDGISALLVTDKVGKQQLFTRGDGNIGQDISPVLKVIQNVPLASNLVGTAVRGELILQKRVFEEKLSKRGANPRNLVGGVINAKIPDMDVLKHVMFIPYNVIHPAMMKPSDQMAALKNTYKFPEVVHHQIIPKANKDLGVTLLSKLFQDRRMKSAFEVDGVVVSHDAPHPLIRDRNPSNAFAFKTIVTENVVNVIVTNVEWNISKDGFLKPVVEFEPVHIAGVQVKRATGFHGEFIHTNVIGPGASILVTRSGDVIPYILKVLAPAASGKPQMPEGVEWTWNSTHKEIQIQDNKNSELIQKQLENFVETIGVHGVGSAIVKKMVQAGFDTVQKIVGITEAKLATVEGFGVRMAEKVFRAFQDSFKKLDCITLMQASNAFGRGFGERKLKTIVRALSSKLLIDSTYLPTLQELVAIDGIQTKTADQFLAGLVIFRDFIKENKLEAYCYPQTHGKEIATDKPQPFTGMTFVFTGFRNAVLQSEIEARGGSVSTSVSKKTNMLITKTEEETSSGKAARARELGVQVMALQDFLKKHGISIL